MLKEKEIDNLVDKEIDNLVDLIFNPLDWDKTTYRFNRDEKDMHPYSIINKKDKVLITHNVLGINKEDLKITRESENGKDYIVINGKTRDDITGREYSVASRFMLNNEEVDLTKISATVKNGLLYITIPVLKEKNKKITDNITIL